MGADVVGYLEIMIQKIRTENEELKKRNEELKQFGEGLLAEYKKVCEEADEMKAFIDKIMQRVEEAKDGTEKEKTDAE
jgi:hypothetical protein